MQLLSANLIDSVAPYPLYRLGWKAFQDLCAAVAEECLKRPVQTFLGSNDGGRDGAFLGTWEHSGGKESSTIQCKFTSSEGKTLGLSMLEDELGKAERLVQRGLAADYVIMTNHRITATSEAAIKEAFKSTAKVKECRVFDGGWISDQIRKSAKLRMMVPRLYGLGDLSDLLDARAYRQAQLILSEMGDNLRKLVITDSHRKSVRAISDHNLVLLLGDPATGKSTIGASLALGATDAWKCSTIKSTSPEHLQTHLNPDGGQFFWIDDAWGSTQYQSSRTEAWNQVFPFIQGAMRRGSRFLITSRTYIWEEAKRDLKIQALPVLARSQVVVNVQELTIGEKARILYNHLKLGDQSDRFKSSVKPHLPKLAARGDFLPESARRLGNSFFTGGLHSNEAGLAAFFANPTAFLQETIQGLVPASKAAIALVFLNGGKVRSPVPADQLAPAAEAFGVPLADLRTHLEVLRDSILLMPHDDQGPYWTYKHPTIGDAFAAYVAERPELVEIYLRGARPESMIGEVVCAGKAVLGAQVVVPESLQDLLLDRIANLPANSLARFVTYRANAALAARLLELRPDIWNGTSAIFTPVREDQDTDLLVSLQRMGLLSEDRRLAFVERVRVGIVEDADDSFLEDAGIAGMFTEAERAELLTLAEEEVLGKFPSYIAHAEETWNSSDEPSGHFEAIEAALLNFAKHIYGNSAGELFKARVQNAVRTAVSDLESRYEPEARPSLTAPQPVAKVDSLADLFRDVDE